MTLSANPSFTEFYVNIPYPILSYIRGGCSPIGMKKHFRTVVDISAEAFDTIIFSAGKIGAQVELAPAALAELVGCSFAPVAKQ